MTRPTLINLRAAYARNENITRILRESAGSDINDQASILIAYDLQAGSYVAALDDPSYRKKLAQYADAVAAVLTSLGPRSVLEPGVGEATTLREVLCRLSPPEIPALGCDLSWSRVHVGRRHLEAGRTRASLFVGEMEALPLPDDAADVVYTSHAVEPNHGREEQILAELYRVAGRYLVLFEPGYEFASGEARARMESHGYCRGLPQAARRAGWKVVEHRPLGATFNPLNPTGVLVIEKRTGQGKMTPPAFACPSCRGPLTLVEGVYFCAGEGLAFPTLRGVPCLARHNAVLASRFLDRPERRYPGGVSA